MPLDSEDKLQPRRGTHPASLNSAVPLTGAANFANSVRCTFPASARSSPGDAFLPAGLRPSQSEPRFPRRQRELFISNRPADQAHGSPTATAGSATSSRRRVLTEMRGVARGAFQTLSLGPLCTAKGPGGSFEGAPCRGRRAAPSVSLEGGGWTHVGARPTGRGTCLSASGVHARRKQLRRTRGALLGPRCPVPPLAVSPLTFPVGKIGTECPRHFQGPPSLPDRTIAGQGPFCPCQASLHHGMLIRLRPQSTPSEQVHTGRLTCTLHARGGSPSAPMGAARALQSGGSRWAPRGRRCVPHARFLPPPRGHCGVVSEHLGVCRARGLCAPGPRRTGTAPFVTRDFALCPRPRPPPSVSASSSLIPASARCDSN